MDWAFARKDEPQSVCDSMQSLQQSSPSVVPWNKMPMRLFLALSCVLLTVYLTMNHQIMNHQVLPVTSTGSCWSGEAIVADMHDGDEKKITVSGSHLTIVPHNNNQTWIVESEVDQKSCSAIVDFNVPGKPGFPPVNLTAQFFRMHALSVLSGKLSVEFTDPSGTIAAAGYPVNEWIEISIKTASAKLRGHTCWTGSAIFADIHDGKEKKITIVGSHLTIEPHNSLEKWVVTSTVDSKSCSAIVDFNVPGKPPGFPPVDLTAQLFIMHALSGDSMSKLSVEFTDPSSTIAAAGYPLNEWVEEVGQV